MTTVAKKTPTPKRPAALARAAQGERTRREILDRAVDLASREGLEGLSIGKLAESLKMSKSGLFAHFGSKEELQLETVNTARQIFVERVITPSLKAPVGMPRLWALCDLWLQHLENKVFSGGCFFSAAALEFDSRQGAVRTRIAASLKDWIQTLQRAIEAAQQEGHLTCEVRAEDLAAELNALEMGGNMALKLFDDRRSIPRTRERMLERLRELATAECPPLPMLARK